MHAPTHRHLGRVLVVDDDPAMRALCRVVLAREGWDVAVAPDGERGLAHVRDSRGDLDCVVTDVNMPEVDGFAFLAAAQVLDEDLPVLMMTADPQLDGAMRAIDGGAVSYLAKPFAPEALSEAVARAARRHGVSRMRRRAAVFLDPVRSRGADERDELERLFRRAVDGHWMAYQPIIDPTTGVAFAYEALLRTEEPSLRRPDLFLGVAERLDRIHELGRRIRHSVARAAVDAPRDALLFVNLHGLELNDEELFSSANPLVPIAERVVLEITERAALDGVADASTRIAMLRRLGFRIALDDLGAGYAGLGSLAALEPDFVKLDMGLVRDIDRDPRKQRIVAATASLCRELGSRIIAEGVETRAERDVVLPHADLIQGFLYARPERQFTVETVRITRRIPCA